MEVYPSVSHFIPPCGAQYTSPFRTVKQIHRGFLRSFALPRVTKFLHTTPRGFPHCPTPRVGQSPTDGRYRAPYRTLPPAPGSPGLARLTRRPGIARAGSRRPRVGRTMPGADAERASPAGPARSGCAPAEILARSASCPCRGPVDRRRSVRNPERKKSGMIRRPGLSRNASGRLACPLQTVPVTLAMGPHQNGPRRSGTGRQSPRLGRHKTQRPPHKGGCE